MSSDGCQKPTWYGSAFPHLPYAPGFQRSGPTYGDWRTNDSAPGDAEASHKSKEATRAEHSGGHQGSVGAVHPSSDYHNRGTGTWAGPAPAGYRGAAGPTYCTDGDANKPTPMTREPTHAHLRGGAKMPMVGLGTYGVSDAKTVVDALDIGYRHLDCAAIYGNEHVVGQAIRPFIDQGRRAELFLTSKLWNDCHAPGAVRAACEKTLKDLGCGYLDLYLVHWPIAFKPGTSEVTDADLLATWRAMEELVDAGLVRNIGVSNFSVRQVEEVLAAARIPPVVNQVELHPRLPMRKMVGVCLRRGVQCVAYSPLGQGKMLVNNEVVDAVAKEVGRTPAQVVLKWNTQRGVPVIPKASSRAHLEENFAGWADWRLTVAQKARLDALDAGEEGRVCKPDWAGELFRGFEDGGAARPAQVFGYDK